MTAPASRSGKRWAEREASLRSALDKIRVPTPHEGARPEESNDELRLLSLLVIWMHLHGYSSEQYIELVGSLGLRFNEEDVTADRFNRWTRSWRAHGIEAPFHSFTLDSVWQAAAAVCIWNGADDLDSESLPGRLGELWTRAQRATESGSDYDEVAGQMGSAELFTRISAQRWGAA